MRAWPPGESGCGYAGFGYGRTDCRPAGTERTEWTEGSGTEGTEGTGEMGTEVGQVDKVEVKRVW